MTRLGVCERNQSTTREIRGRAAIMNDNHASMDVTANDNALIPELPFLVTHWLCSYQGPEAGDGGNPEREEAIERLRNATSEMAAAFSSLGAYGTSSRVCSACDSVFSFALS